MDGEPKSEPEDSGASEDSDSDSADAQRKTLSVAIPVNDEEAVLPELLRRLRAVLDPLPLDYELVFVDDGSRDRSLSILREAAAADERIQVVSLARNFGHQAAVSAGLDFVSGDYVVVMDADLQDVPEAIPQFLAESERGNAVVYARRTQRKESLPLRFCYWLFYRVQRMFSSVETPMDAGDFALMTRPVVEAIRSSPERQRYVRGLRAWVGFQQTGIDVERAERAAGRSHYSIWKLTKLALDGILSFSIAPLRAATCGGLLGMLLPVGYVVFAAYMKVRYDQPPAGFTSLVAIMVFLASVNLLFLGILGEYVGRIYEETKRRPLYVVREVIGGRDRP